VHQVGLDWIKLRQIPCGCQGVTEDDLRDFLK